jgi:hypothetical protein
MTGIELKAILAIVIVALGITAPLPDFLGGMIIGFGACYGIMIVSNPASRLSLWATLFIGFLCAIFAAILHPHIALIRGFPLQAVMGIAAALSKPIMEALISFGAGLKQWAGDLPTKFKFPNGDK